MQYKDNTLPRNKLRGIPHLACRQAGILIWGVLLFSLASPSLGSYISLNTDISAAVEGKNLKVAIAVENKGDEAACNAQAEVILAGKSYFAEKMPELPVNGSYKAEFNLPMRSVTPGTYPLLIVFHYTDANQYPFSALTCRSFVVGNETPSPLFGKTRSISFSKEGILPLTLKNMGTSTIKAKAYLFAPQELTVAEKTPALVILPRSEVSINFSLKNFSALAGSTYQAYVITEFEDAGMHYTNIVPGIIKITSFGQGFSLNYTLVFILLIVILIVFFGAQFIHAKNN